MLLDPSRTSSWRIGTSFSSSTSTGSFTSTAVSRPPKSTRLQSNRASTSGPGSARRSVEPGCPARTGEAPASSSSESKTASIPERVSLSAVRSKLPDLRALPRDRRRDAARRGGDPGRPGSGGKNSEPDARPTDPLGTTALGRAGELPRPDAGGVFMGTALGLLPDAPVRPAGGGPGGVFTGGPVREGARVFPAPLPLDCGSAVTSHHGLPGDDGLLGRTRGRPSPGTGGVGGLFGRTRGRPSPEIRMRYCISLSPGSLGGRAPDTGRLASVLDWGRPAAPRLLAAGDLTSSASTVTVAWAGLTSPDSARVG